MVNGRRRSPVVRGAVLVLVVGLAGLACASTGNDAECPAASETCAATTSGNGGSTGAPVTGSGAGTAETSSDGEGSVSTGGTDDGAPEPACRTYATDYTFASSLGASYDYTCTHAETAQGFEQICTQGGAVDTTHWSSRADFVDEAGAVGLIHAQRTTRDTGGDGVPDFTTTFVYDEAGRLTTVEAADVTSAAFDAWDDYGRPTHGTRSGSCAGAEILRTYDDVARIWIDEEVSAQAECDTRIELSFDEDLIRTGATYPDGVSATYTTRATATVCK